MTQKQLDSLKLVQQKLEQDGISQFNDKTNPLEVQQNGLIKYSASRKLALKIGDLQHAINVKTLRKVNS